MATKAISKTTGSPKKISSPKAQSDPSLKNNDIAGSQSLSGKASIISPHQVKTTKPANADKTSSKKGTKKQAVESIGRILQHVRSTKNLSVFSVSQALRISERYIHGIESMDRTALPEKVYTLGFVRSYAQHLGIDPEDTLAQFKTELYSQAQDKKSKQLDIPQPVTLTMLPSPQIILFCLVTLFTLASAFWYWHMTTQNSIDEEITTLLAQPEQPGLALPDLTAEPSGVSD